MSSLDFISRISSVRQLAERLVVFAAIWWIITQGDPTSWVFGVPFVIAAAIAASALTPRRAWRIFPLSVLRFVWFFAYQSLVGGLDVALRSFSPSMPLDPEVLRYRMRLGSTPAQVLFADVISLLPGTLSTGFEKDDIIVVHVLDNALPIAKGLAEAEVRIADFFGCSLLPLDALPEGFGLSNGGKA